MKHIKPYKIFESNDPNFPTTREEVVKVCEYYKIENYTIDDDLSIDVDGSIGLYNKNLEHLPLKFNYVHGGFQCNRNKLKSLEGCPKTVGGDFYCFTNELKSLEGCPKTVGGDFYCFTNELKDLEHFPEVNGRIDIEENPVDLLVHTFIENANSFMIEDFVDYEIVRNRDTVMLDRLQTFIRDNDLEMPDLEEIKKEYKIIE
jgi:hypothetical protein